MGRSLELCQCRGFLLLTEGDREVVCVPLESEVTPEGEGVEDDFACYDLLAVPRDDGSTIIRLDFSACDDEEIHCTGAKEEKELASLGRSTLRPLFLYYGSEVWLGLDKQERAAKELIGLALPAEDESLRVVRERVA